MSVLRARGSGSPVANLREEMREMWGNGPGETGPRNRQGPPVDIYEEGDELVLECEFPGMDREHIEVNFQNNQLTVSATHDEETEEREEERDYYRRERRREHLKRSFLLPNFVDPEEIEAEYSDGVIRIRLPSIRDEEAHRVEIE